MNFESEKNKPLFIRRRILVAVDFDKTLHSYHKGWHDGTIYGNPIPGSAEAMSLLKDAGCEIMIYSCRNYERHEKHTGKNEPWQISEMGAWLKKHNIPFDRFWTHCAKPPADLFIDDKGLRFEGNWSETLTQAFKIIEGLKRKA